MPPPGFQAVVDQYYESLFRFGYSLSGNRDDACDLVQQTFFIWARHGGALRDSSKVKSWLFTTLYREFLKLHRHLRRMTPVEQPELNAVPDDPSDLWITRLDVPAVVAGLSQVDELFRVPITLFYLEELSYKEIANVLGVPIGTVMSRLARGKQQLKRALSGMAAPAKDETGRIIPWPKTHREGSHG